MQKSQETVDPVGCSPTPAQATRYLGGGAWLEPPAPGAWQPVWEREDPGKHRPHENSRQGDRFCPYSLIDWLEAADRARVPALHAEPAAVFEAEDLRNAEWSGPHQARLNRAWSAARAAQGADGGSRSGGMLRWDACAPGLIKSHFDGPREGPLPGAERRRLDLDSRTMDILHSWPRPLMPAWVRPWIEDEVEQIGGWPLEYRVFAGGGRIEGISSYYIQRALAEPAPGLEAVRRSAERILSDSGLHGPCDWPVNILDKLTSEAMWARFRGGDARDPNGVYGTMDFMVLKSGEALLLEGGPPVWAGAHPCFFQGRKIEGVALAVADE